MPKKTPPDNRRAKGLHTVHTAGDGAARVLQRISARARVVLPGQTVAAMPPPAWLERLRAALPEELRPHLVGVLEKSDGLVLFAASAAWAGRLKLELPDLAGAAENRPLKVRLAPQQRAALR